MSEQPPPYPPSSPDPQQPGSSSDPSGYPSYTGVPPTHQSYGGQPYQPYQAQPMSAYPAAPGFPGSPYGGPQPKNHTTRNVLLVVALVVVLVCGGGIALVAVAISHGIDDVANSGNYAGNPDAPLTIKEGDGFTIGPNQYSSGWTIAGGSTRIDDAISGLSVKNTSGDANSPRIDIKFLKGTTVVGQISCDVGSSDLSQGQDAAMQCTNYAKAITGYDTIKVSDSYKHYSY